MMRLSTRRLAAIAALLVAPGAAACAQPPRPGVRGASASDSAQARAAAARFLAAFDSLQLEPFRAALAPDVTVFMPGGASPWARLDGRAAVEAEFGRMFDAVRARQARDGRRGPATLGVGPRVRDLRVQVVGPAAAVVSFQLGEDSALGRRSLVFGRADDGVWRVVHWHASNARPAGGG